jgi:hypothetical protein
MMKTVYEYDRDDIAKLILADMAENGDIDDSGHAVFQWRDHDGAPVIAVTFEQAECCGECQEDESGVNRALEGIVDAIVKGRAKAEEANKSKGLRELAREHLSKTAKSRGN